MSSRIHSSAIIYGKSSIGKDSLILENVIIGYPHTEILNITKAKGISIEDYQFQGATIGDNALIRANTIIYCDVSIGRDFRSGHNVLIRENTQIGDNVSVGTSTIVEGNTVIGNNVNIQSNVFIPRDTIIEDFVFIGPNAVLTNDKYPIRKNLTLKGPVIRKGVSVGANAILLPGIEIGEGSLIAAGAVVTRDVPAWALATGFPAKITELPQELRVLNKI
ncbi:MAG TPA: DapH/DapD/GlmU-related protein [Dehalococcoidales bacterium]|nr:DapH/DapD/GlmU-related protein [Dehalococcoidales bacterium]